MENNLNTVPKPFVFVLMPFVKDFEDIYEVGIKPACKDAGAYCERVDEQIFEESILERIYNQIGKADLIVADMSGRNPNVFYETGYAHALGKQVILLTQNAQDIPFDLKHYSHIVYEGKIALLKDALERRVRWFIENPKASIARTESELEFYIKGVKLTDKVKGIRFPIADDAYGTKTLRFHVSVHNGSNKVIDASLIELGLILPTDFEEGINISTVRLPGDKCMHLLPRLGRLLPDSWYPVQLDIRVKNIESIRQEEYEFSLRIFTEFGPRDMPFKLWLS